MGLQRVGHDWVAEQQGQGNLHSVRHSGCISLFPSQCKRVPFSLHPLQPLLFVDFVMIAVLADVRWYFIVVLISISLIISEVEHLFRCLLAICMSYFGEKIDLVPTFFVFIGLLVFLWYWAAWAAYIFWRLILCHFLLLEIFSPIQSYLFVLCMVSFALQKLQ